VKNKQNRSSVPLSRPLTLGQRDNLPCKGDKEHDSDGIVDLKALAREVLKKEKTRNSTANPIEPMELMERNRIEGHEVAEGKAFLPHDRYAFQVQKMLRHMNQPDYPSGMILWLGSSHPWLYRILVSYLPDIIHSQWEHRLPIHEFKRTLDDLLEVHRAAVLLYRAEARQ
jgi:hypothetical protein